MQIDVIRPTNPLGAHPTCIQVPILFKNVREIIGTIRFEPSGIVE